MQKFLPKGVEYVFVRQAEQLGLGHAISCIERIVEKEQFAVLPADDVLTMGEKGQPKS